MRALLGYSILIFFVLLTGFCGTMVIVQHNAWVRLMFVPVFFMGFGFCKGMIQGAREDMRRNGRR